MLDSRWKHAGMTMITGRFSARGSSGVRKDSSVPHPGLKAGPFLRLDTSNL